MVQDLTRSIVVGTVYNIFHEEFPTDEDFFKEVDRDIETMKICHITHLMIFPMGQWNPETKLLDWSRTDYLVRKIESTGLKFVPLMLKEEQCSHFFPIWKFKEIKGLWSERELRNGSRNNRENVDFADPGIYPLVEDYFQQVAARYAKSPALGFYNLWNEPHYNSDAEHVIERFRKWLEKKYGDLKSLRRIWGKEYSDWKEVSPFLNDNWNSSMPQIDWNIFRAELNGILAGELVTSLRKHDDTHAVTSNPVGTPWMSFHPPGGYDTDDVPIVEHNDVHGISYYPDIWEREHEMRRVPFWLHNLAFNMVRCSAGDKDYLLTELYTNAQNGLALNGYLSKESLRLISWTAISNDCKGVIYWKWRPFMRGRQSLGRGLCRADGELAPRGEAVKELGAIAARHGPAIYSAKLRKPHAAILLDMVGLLKTLEQQTEPATQKFMYESNAGLYEALYNANITADFLRTDRGLTAGKLTDYKIVFLPFQIVMRQRTADLLKEYVRQGGWLVADARTATLDEFDFAFKTSPGAGLDELFGAVRTDWIGTNGYHAVQMNAAKGKSAFQFEGRFFREHLQLKGSVDVLATFVDTKEAAIVQNRYGKGRAILSAIPLGASCFGRKDNPVDRIILSFAAVAGARPEATFISAEHLSLDVKVHSSGRKLVVYAINNEEVPKTGILEIETGEEKYRKAVDIITDDDIDFKEAAGKIEINLRMRAGQIVVLTIE